MKINKLFILAALSLSLVSCQISLSLHRKTTVAWTRFTKSLLMLMDFLAMLMPCFHIIPNIY